MIEEENNIEETKDETKEPESGLQQTIAVSGMYENWFLDYASYVILERAVPAIEDGFKPVQRRIMHAMKEMDDGRYNKVANIIGQTMQYHPHGDASIGDALVNLGQKDLLIDTQGNWGDFRTGDSAAAPRYIEARLSKFALDVVFNAKTTGWQLSYDGRKKEPVTLPVKFPLLLAQGVEGIAVGLATKILPHNFCELIEASIDVLNGKEIALFPDFPTGGMADVSNYNHGQKGGRIRVRAKIEEYDKKTLIIKDIPYGVTTGNLMDSIVKANDSGKIKIKKVVDNTAKDVEIQIQLAPGISPDVTIDALYAFSDCEVSLAPNTCVIINEKPIFIGVEELLKHCTEQTKKLLRLELQIRLQELEDNWHYSSLEKIFIENRIYRDIEECETWEAVLEAIDKGLEPFKKLLRREVTTDDITKLTEIKIKRISKFDSFKADEYIKGLENEIDEVQNHLLHLNTYAINYFKGLLKKYGKGRERKTEIKAFDTIQAQVVAVANQKLYMNKDEGFVGYGLKKDEYVCDCSDIDDIIVIREDGVMQVSKVQEKAFVGKKILYANVFRRNDDRMTYNLVYQDGESGLYYVKRFNVSGITRDKEYHLTQGTKGSKIIYFSANPNGEAEVVSVVLSPNSKARRKLYDFDFSEVAIKSRSARGNIFSRYRVKNVKLKEKGKSTHGGRDLWFDSSVGKLNTDHRGDFIGNFEASDLILVVYANGFYEICNTELTQHFDNDAICYIKKYKPQDAVSCVFKELKTGTVLVKRFLIETQTVDKKFLFLQDEKNYRVMAVTQHKQPEIKIEKKVSGNTETVEMNLTEFTEIRGWKTIGTKLGGKEISNLTLLEQEEEEDAAAEELEDNVGLDLESNQEEKAKVEAIQPKLFD